MGLDVVADTSIVMIVFATLAVAWSWLGSYAGIVSFGHAIFFGIGGYAVAVSNLRGGSPWYGALGGALFATLIAVLGGLLCLRGRGYTFSAITLVAGALAQPFAASRVWVGPQNAYAFPVKLGFLHLQFSQKWPYVLLALAVFAVAQALTYGLHRSRIGYYVQALRTNLGAARGMGINPLPPRLLVLAASAFVTSVAGSFFAEYSLAVSPQAMFGLWLSFDIALIGVICTSAAVWGAPLAGIAYVLIARLVPLHPPGAAGVAVLLAEGVAIGVIATVRSHGGFGVRRRTPATAGGSAA